MLIMDHSQCVAVASSVEALTGPVLGLRRGTERVGTERRIRTTPSVTPHTDTRANLDSGGGGGASVNRTSPASSSGR